MFVWLIVFWRELSDFFYCFRRSYDLKSYLVFLGCLIPVLRDMDDDKLSDSVCHRQVHRSLLLVVFHSAGCPVVH